MMPMIDQADHRQPVTEEPAERAPHRVTRRVLPTVWAMRGGAADEVCPVPSQLYRMRGSAKA